MIPTRFAKDVDVCDNTLPQNLRSWLSTFANFIGTIVVIISVVPWFGIAIVPIAIIFYFVQTIYVNTARQLKRLESVSRSPIYSHFGETLSGASTIRAFGLQNKFTLQSEALVDKNQICYFPTIMANRWLAVRLETIGNFITFAGKYIHLSILFISTYLVISCDEKKLIYFLFFETRKKTSIFNIFCLKFSNNCLENFNHLKYTLFQLPCLLSLMPM